MQTVFYLRKVLCTSIILCSTIKYLYTRITLFRTESQNEPNLDEYQTHIVSNWRFVDIPNLELKYLLQPTGRCMKNYHIVMVICSAVNHFNRRMAIRKTLGKTYRDMWKVFLVGTPTSPHNSKVDDRLLDEYIMYGDLIQANFIDSYRNLTLKSLYMLHWVKTYCNNTNYLLKVDDDMYVNIQNLLTALEEVPFSNYIMGYLVKGTRPVLDKTLKFYTPLKLYPHSSYPTYLSGTAYIISMSILEKLYDICIHLQLFWLEDVFITGICARKAKIKMVNRDDFGIYSPNGCLAKSIVTGHEVEWTALNSVHNGVINSSIKCIPRFGTAAFKSVTKF